jgi:hypothetical protein
MEIGWRCEAINSPNRRDYSPSAPPSESFSLQPLEPQAETMSLRRTIKAPDGGPEGPQTGLSMSM